MNASYQGQRLIKISAVEAILGHKRSWVYKRIEKGLIPAPTRLSTRDVVWDEAAIIAVKDRILSGTFLPQ